MKTNRYYNTVGESRSAKDRFWFPRVFPYFLFLSSLIWIVRSVDLREGRGANGIYIIVSRRILPGGVNARAVKIIQHSCTLAEVVPYKGIRSLHEACGDDDDDGRYCV